MASAQAGTALSDTTISQLDTLGVTCTDAMAELQKNRAIIRQLYERMSDVLAASLDAVNAHLNALRLDVQVDEMLEAELSRVRGSLERNSGADNGENEDYNSALQFLSELAVSCHPTLKQLARSSSQFSRLSEQKALVEIADGRVKCAVPLRCVHSDGNLANALLAASIIGHRLDLFRQQQCDEPAAAAAAVTVEEDVPSDQNVPPAPTQSFSNMVKKTSSAAPVVRRKVDVQSVSFSGQLDQGGARPRRPLLAAHPVNPVYCLIVETQQDNHRVLIELNMRMARSLCVNFMKLCDSGLYNGSNFHHAIPGDQIHGGYIDRNGGRAANINPGSANRFFTPELSPLKDQYATIRMRGMESSYSTGVVNCQVGSQFFVWLSETRQYMERDNTLVFGRIVEGISVLDQISRLHRPALLANTILFAGRFDGSR